MNGASKQVVNGYQHSSTPLTHRHRKRTENTGTYSGLGEIESYRFIAQMWYDNGQQQDAPNSTVRAGRLYNRLFESSITVDSIPS